MNIKQCKCGEHPTMNMMRRGFSLECPGCGTGTKPMASLEDAIQTWNTLATPIVLFVDHGDMLATPELADCPSDAFAAEALTIFEKVLGAYPPPSVEIVTAICHATQTLRGA